MNLLRKKDGKNRNNIFNKYNELFKMILLVLVPSLWENRWNKIGNLISKNFRTYLDFFSPT